MPKALETVHECDLRIRRTVLGAQEYQTIHTVAASLIMFGGAAYGQRAIWKAPLTLFSAYDLRIVKTIFWVV